MSNQKSLKELTEKEFNTLKKSGLLQTIYPDAPDNYKEIKGTRPKLIDNPDLKKLIATCEAHLDSVEKGESEDSDDDHYIYEEAMSCLYGKEVWDFINSIT